MIQKNILSVAILSAFVFAAAPAYAVSVERDDGARKPAVTTTAGGAAKIACVGAAVNTREAALNTAMLTFTGATNTAYTARATALRQAYTGTSTKMVRDAAKSAWTTFTSSEKAARKAWKATRDASWKTYRTDATACKAPEGTGDGANSTSEKSGD